MKIPKKIIFICFIISLLFTNTNIFANPYPYPYPKTYDQCKDLLDDDFFVGNLEDIKIVFNNNEYKCKKFEFSNTLYLPLRNIMSILNKKVQYNSTEKTIDITDEFNNDKYNDIYVMNNIVKKNYATVRYNGEIISHYTGNSIKNFKQPPSFLNIDGLLYMKINMLGEDFNYIYNIDNNLLKIKEFDTISQIKNIKDFGYKSTTNYLNKDNLFGYESLINDILLHERNLRLGPDTLLEQKYKFVEYKSNLCLYVETTTKIWSNNIEKNYEALYCLNNK